VAFIAPVRKVVIARTGIKCILARVVRYAVNVAANHRVVEVAQWCAREAAAFGAVVSVGEILAKGIGEFDRLPVVGRIINIDRRCAITTKRLALSPTTSCIIRSSIRQK